MGSCQCGNSFQKESTIDFVEQKNLYEGINGTLKDYNIDPHAIGEGAFGSVHKAIHKASGQLRAIKILSKESQQITEQNAMKQEVALLKSLDHPNIIKIYDYFESDTSFYIVTELCTGGELFDKITELSQFNEKDAAKVMKAILSGLYYCHQLKIVHRDIKPENLLYDCDGKDSQLKLIDFGTSRHFDSSHKLTEKIGTAYYIAPEVIMKDYTEKCDIWSAGVVLYIMLCGEPPFNGNSDQKIIEKIKKGEYTFNSPEWLTVSAEAKAFIRKMMEFNVDKRLSAEQALQDPWILKLSSEHVDAPIVQGVLQNLKQFRTTQRFQEASFMYIVKQFATKEETQELLRTFQNLDKNGDGVLSFKELLDGYTQAMGAANAEIQVTEIFQQVDKNQSGIIDYSEFVAATINRTKLLSQDRLEAAFRVIDRDGSGYISVDELRGMFGQGQVPQDAWQQILQEVDKNGDGQISLQEFKDMMFNLTI